MQPLFWTVSIQSEIEDIIMGMWRSWSSIYLSFLLWYTQPWCFETRTNILHDPVCFALSPVRSCLHCRWKHGFQCVQVMQSHFRKYIGWSSKWQVCSHVPNCMSKHNYAQVYMLGDMFLCGQRCHHTWDKKRLLRICVPTMGQNWIQHNWLHICGSDFQTVTYWDPWTASSAWWCKWQCLRWQCSILDVATALCTSTWPHFTVCSNLASYCWTHALWYGSSICCFLNVYAW